MNIDKKELLKLIVEVKNSMTEDANAPPQSVQNKPVINQTQQTDQNKPVTNQTQKTVQNTPPKVTSLPPTGLPIMQGLSDMLYISKNPQYPVLKPWLQSLGVRVK